MLGEKNFEKAAKNHFEAAIWEHGNGSTKKEE
jgi:hypothetical protein